MGSPSVCVVVGTAVKERILGLLGPMGVAEAGGDEVAFCGDAGGTGVGSGVADAAGEVCVGLVVAVFAGGGGVGVGVVVEISAFGASTSAWVGR
jgi:hypothetical protein